MRWRGSQLDYRPGVIVVRDINIFPLLHELAHATDGHQWWQGSQRIEALDYERTNGHGLSFKCLALDLYNITASLKESIYETSTDSVDATHQTSPSPPNEGRLPCQPQ